MHVVDWMPTLFEAAGIDINDLGLNYSLDGVSQWKGLTGDDNENDDKYFAYRDSIWYNYATKIWNTDFTGFNLTAFRYKWNKIVNGTGAVNEGGEGHYKPDLSAWEWINHKHIKQRQSSDDKMYQFYDLENDPNEYNDIMNVTGQNNETFINVINKMIDIEKTARPQMVNDMNCPPFGPQNNSVVGPVYMPWC